VPTRFKLHWQVWVHGLIGAALSGGGNAVVACVIKPDAFNIKAQLSDTLSLFFASAILASILYMRTKPVPEMEEVTEKTEFFTRKD
jgi:hypothetical protein